MKKLGLFILGLFTVFFIGNFTHANDYEYTNLSISAHILEDGTVNVTEKYTADFFVSKHGIIRTIPLNYTVAGNQFHIDISDVDVEGKTFTTNTSNGEVSIKIGDADKTIIGEQIYPISYTTYGLIKNFSGMGYSELYWNLVGNEFDTNINKVKSVIYLPKIYTGFTSDDFLITVDGSKTSVYDFQGRFDRSHGDRIIITYDEGLNAYEGITLAIKFPNGYFEFDHDKQSGLLGVATYDDNDKYSDNEYNNPVIAENISSDPVKSDTEQLNLIPKTIDGSSPDQEIKPSTNVTTSNNYISTGPKTKPHGNSEYEYTNLNINANILNDGTINVSENFITDFHVNKHGIIRVIPLNYSVEGNNFHIDVFNIDVAGKKFSTSKVNGEIEIKIGDANRTVIGEQTYPISYTTYGLIRNFAGMGYSELYWNLVGNEFDTNINSVQAEIYLPKTYTGLTADDFLITVDGSTTSVNDFQGRVDWGGGNKIIINYDRGLSSYQGITLAVKFPNDYFEFDHNKQAKLIGHVGNGGINLSNITKNFISWISGLLGIIAVVLFVYKKITNSGTDKINRKSGALKGDFAKKFPVIVQYEPPKGINSAEAGLLLHRRAKPKDMLSLIYKRAAEGLIKLSFEETSGGFFKSASKKVIITKIKDIDTDSPTPGYVVVRSDIDTTNEDIYTKVPTYEKDFFRALVRGEKNKITETTNLYEKLSLDTLESYGKSKGRFHFQINKGYLIPVYLILVFIGVPMLLQYNPQMGIVAFLLLRCLGFFGGSKGKMKITEEGARLISHILGYREFLAACDENKLREFLKQDPLYFDKILPYAVAFGLDTELIKKMEPIMQEMNIKSSWYDGDINSIHLINNTIGSSATHSVPPHYDSDSGFSSGSSFGGGGGGFSSGGGGGGGGGRSW